MIKCKQIAIKIDPHEFNQALNTLHDPSKQSQLIKDQIQLVKHRFYYIKTTPLKVLTEDCGFHKTLYVQEQKQLHYLLDEARNLKKLPAEARANQEKELCESLKNIVYNPELDYSKYELSKEVVSRRTVVCHIQVAAMNIISFMMIDENLQSRERMRLFYEELSTYFLVERLTTAACINNRVTQALALHFSYMPKVVSAIMKEKLKLIKNDNNHYIENASFLNRLLTNFSIYFNQLEDYQQITQQHKIYEVLMFYKDLQEVDNSSIELADELMAVIRKNKQALINFLHEIFSVN